MSKTILFFASLFILLTIAQALVFNQICLFGVALPLVFIYFIIKMPMSWPTTVCLILAFLLGLSIDILSNTQGLNALCCTLLASCRRPILRLYFPREEEMSEPEPSSKSIGLAEYLKYSFTLTFLYCILFFVIESLTFFDFFRLIIKIIASTILSYLFILALDSLSRRKQ
ncbi:MAG: rod shape-determining protein MreD [Muribaculaceae bacterium]|nr:rod shape-determining protein MreD [Muribaculaceae bacterium]MDE5969010.1 rod shape-determining protein MreD [Muribaculaceae bacterium]MDE7393470.1 rod shape-determining protein MreD [Muribaculaceae bacterium]